MRLCGKFISAQPFLFSKTRRELGFAHYLGCCEFPKYLRLDEGACAMDQLDAFSCTCAGQGGSVVKITNGCALCLCGAEQLVTG